MATTPTGRRFQTNRAMTPSRISRLIVESATALACQSPTAGADSGGHLAGCPVAVAVSMLTDVDAEELTAWVATTAVRVFHASGPVTLLPGERDLNARVGDHVFKAHAPEVDADELDLQDAALDHLSRSPAARLVPRSVPPMGDSWVEVDGLRRRVRLLEWVSGRMLADVDPQSPELLRDLGRAVAAVDLALSGMTHPAQGRHSSWNLLHVPALLDVVEHVQDPNQRAAVEGVVAWHRAEVAPVLARLPHQLIHGDANDFNVVVDDEDRVRGIIDFGDLMTAPRVCGLAIAAAYAMFRQADPVRGILPLVAGYHEVAPLWPAELAVLEPLIRGRLATTLVMSAHEHHLQPDNDYLLVSQADAWRVLQQLRADSADLAHYRFRDACGLDAHPQARDVRQFLLSGKADPAPVLGAPLAELARVTLDWSIGTSAEATSSAGVRAALREPGAEVAVGRYGEDRAVYQSPEFEDPATGEARTVHLGVDLFVPAGHPVHAALDGTITAFGDNQAHLDYGPVIVLEHRTDLGVPFWTLYGHLARESLLGLDIGACVARGERLAEVGAEDVNGGWPPHLHLQILVDLVGRGLDVPGVAGPTERMMWQSLSPDPNLLLGDPRGVSAMAIPPTSEVARLRRTSLSSALSISYDEPLRIVRGEGARLFDERGRSYLDLVNNVAHVGHAHPRVVAALTRAGS